MSCRAIGHFGGNIQNLSHFTMSRLIISCYLLFFLNTTALAIPIIHKTQTSYKINGNTAQDLRKQMDILGPLINEKHFDAKTSWQVNWQYTWRYDDPSQNPCYVVSVNVSVDSNILLPEWANQNSGISDLQNKWNNYLTRLTTHEQGHENNGIEAAAEIEVALLNHSSMPNCQALEIALDNVATQIIKQHNNWDVQYDTDTNHGKTQGAIFP